MTDVPHFSLPFRFATPQALRSASRTRSTRSPTACSRCCSARRASGWSCRSFGLPDPTFSTPAPDLDSIRETVEIWEPRAAVVLDEHPDLLDELVSHVEVDVTLRTED